jgi:hypothetical protein
MLSLRGYFVELADVYQGSRLVGDVDSKVIVSRGYSRRNRSSDPRHNAKAQVRRTVAAPVACNQVLPTFLIRKADTFLAKFPQRKSEGKGRLNAGSKDSWPRIAK